MKKPRRMSVVDRVGERHGRLVVVSRAENKIEPSGAVRAQWKCQCSCGAETVTSGQSLSRGATKSCGCLIAETRRSEATHGQSGTSLYRVWSMMRQRCENPKATQWASYGGRGIAVCERWKSFPNFQADLPPRPAGGTLERVDNNKGYEPGNVVWASRLDQAQNRRTSVRLALGEEEHTIAEWGRITGLGKHVIGSRIQAGWSVARALTEGIHDTGTRRRKRTIP